MAAPRMRLRAASVLVLALTAALATSAPASAHGRSLRRPGSAPALARPPKPATPQPVGSLPLRTNSAQASLVGTPLAVVRGVKVVHSAPVLANLPVVRPPQPVGRPPAVLVRRGTIVAQTAASSAMPSATQWVRAMPTALAKAPVLSGRVLQRRARVRQLELPKSSAPPSGAAPAPAVAAPRPASAPAGLAVVKVRSFETIPNLPGLSGGPDLPAAASSSTRTISELRALNYVPLSRTASTNQLPGSGYAQIPIGYGRVPEGLTAAARPATATPSEYTKFPPPIYTAAPALRRGNLERTSGATGISNLPNARAAVARNPIAVAQPKGPTVSAAAPPPN